MTALRVSCPARTVPLFAVSAAWLGLAGCSNDTNESSRVVRVAIAANMAPAMEQLQREFFAQSGVRVVAIVGASGSLAKQIAEGAPYDAFVSADVSFVDEAIASSACVASTKSEYARGRLALWTSELAPDLHDVDSITVSSARSLERVFGRMKKIAIANPEHAPYGRAAIEMLDRLRLGETVRSKLVYGGDVQQARQFVLTGNAEGAILPYSLIRDEKYVVLVDSALHAPLIQAVTACSRGKNPHAGERFVRFMQSPAARATLTLFGYTTSP